ncbi:hypothetical protein F7725_025574 [Dissostichus mawsoni]|uniref:LIM/homeobox protein Lhx9 n=1 Tax=Dissostichus mawsoni TaxID=36200 RepID=A0A7J5XBL2_DISMA|nr:hypothetical protein F7725_025574 [Dissostichus mawsoni]
MMSADDRALEELLYGSDLGDLGDHADIAELSGARRGRRRVLLQTTKCVARRVPALQPVSLRAADTPLAVLQRREHLLPPGLLQPIPASDLVMRSGDLTFHPHCFSCQECDVTLIPGNLYCMQGHNLYCQSHYHDDGRSMPPLNDLQPKPNLKEGEGEESVSSPEPPLDDQVACGRTRRRNKRIRTCFRSEQLRALESYFAHKHNPDGKDWNFLAQNTGLPKRVLQNARAKLRRSLTADDSQVSSPSAPPRGLSMSSGSSPGACSPPDQSQPFSSTSTIDQLQLSLLTAPLNEPPLSPAASQLQNPAFFLDYDSQSAPGCVSSLEAYEDFGEAERAEAEVDSDSSFRPHFC